MEKKQEDKKKRRDFQVKTEKLKRETLPIVAVTHFHILLSLFCE